MNEELRDILRQYCDLELTYSDDWVTNSAMWEVVYAIGEHGYGSEDIDTLPPKQRTIFPVLAMLSSVQCDGFLSIFYNDTLHEIKRLRQSIGVLGLDTIGNIFDEAFPLVQSKFTWSDEHVNFCEQVGWETNPHTYFGREIVDRFEEWEKQINDIFTSEEFEKHLESYLKSTK